MKNLLHKEFKLSVHPTCYLFLLLSAMLLIPNYPYYVAFFYQTLGIFFIFVNGNINNDIAFTTLFPIRKREAVKARFFTVIILELLQIIVSIPFAILRNTLIPGKNLAGMDANLAFFGLVFIMFGVFNAVFLPMFYQTAYKTGAPYLVACAAMTVFVVIAEAAINLIPNWKSALDIPKITFSAQQMITLVAGVILSVALTVFAYTKSAAQFERLDL